MIRAFLFDIGNVLLKFDLAPAMARISALSDVGDPVDVLGRIDQLKSGFEEGQFDRATFLRSIFDVLRYRGTEDEFTAAWNEIFEPNAPMVALLEQLHGRFPLYLLSNTNEIHRDYFLSRYPFFRYFDAGIYSDVVRASKPNRAIYELTARQLGLEPAATFFIDDLLPNIEAAREFGFHAHHYHHERHDLLLAELRQLAII
jgi:putative hydrolase of the HAD superfamily